MENSLSFKSELHDPYNSYNNPMVQPGAIHIRDRFGYQ